GGDGRMPALGAEQGGVDIEGAAGDDQPVDEAEVCGNLLRLVRQQDRDAAGANDGGAVILAERIPGQLRIAAGRLRIQGETDHGLVHDVPSYRPGLRKPRRM